MARNGDQPLPSELRAAFAADRLDAIVDEIDRAQLHAHDGHLSVALEEVMHARRALQAVERLIKTGAR